jgi:tetratricopeptide (TPR) repeat protein
MKKAYCFTICLLALSSWLYAQSVDSLVRFNELTFYSEFERETFLKFQKRDVDLFALLMSNGNLLSDEKVKEGREKFYRYVAAVGNETAGKKTEKRVKVIYDNLHNKFLTKYELKNRFEEIFYNGYYNCVSATALYALAFEELKIPYSIKEEPTHVYIVAYPNGERIILETTSPLGGYYSLSDDFKQNYIRKLKDQKLISAQEYATQDGKLLFDKYYFGQNTEVSLQQLAGIQYLNDAIYKADDKKPDESFRQLEKAYLLYPSERIANLLFYTGLQSFEAHKEKDSTHAVMLSKLSRYTSQGVDPEMILGEFGRVTQDLLFSAGKKKQYEQYYRILDRSITHEKIKSDLAYYYQYENGHLLYTQGKYKDALPYFEKTLTLKPENLELQGIFLSTMAQTFNAKKNNLEIIKQLDDYNTRFTTLQANNHFNSMRATAYLLQFNMSYSMDKISEGDKYRTLFETVSNKYPDATIDANLIGQSYSNAAVYYYRKGQVSKARQLLATGLKYAPDNYELITRQRMIK